MEHKDTDDWVLVYGNIAVAGERGRGRGRKTWKECVADDMKKKMRKIALCGEVSFWGTVRVRPVQARAKGR